MTEERVPRRDFLKVTAGTALTFGAGLPATAQTSASAPPSPPFSTAQPAEFIFKNAKVITVDANFSIARAIAIGGARIVAVGEAAAMAAHAARATRIIDLKGKSVIPGRIDGHAHMDREGLKSIYPSLGQVRSIRDIQARIADLARKTKHGEWIVTMPIGDPPYYFKVPQILAEKRWPTRQDLDAAAPNNPVFIRSIWGFWRHTLPLVSCANTEALKRAGITRDTVSPVDVLTIEKDANGEPTGVFIEREMQPIARADLVSPSGGLHARRPRPRHADVGSRLSCLRHDQRVRGARRRQRTPARLQGRVSRWFTHDAFGIGVQPELESGGWGAVGPADRGVGRMARRARARRRLAQDGRSHRRHRKQSSGRCARDGVAIHRLGGVQLRFLPATPQGQGGSAAARGQ